MDHERADHRKAGGRENTCANRRLSAAELWLALFREGRHPFPIASLAKHAAMAVSIDSMSR